MTTFNRLPMCQQIKVLKRVTNYPTLTENLNMLIKVDPILYIRKNGVITFRGNAKELFKKFEEKSIN